MNILDIRPFLTFLIASSAVNGNDELMLGEEQFKIHCVACHQVDQALVGPSLVEVTKLYRKDKDSFVKWCLEPGKKRKEAIQMPSMAHVGKEKLLAIHSYIIQEAKGKKERTSRNQETRKKDLYPLPKTRPLIQRMFIEGAGSAAIAVALPNHELNYTFDAAACRLRFTWKSPDFVDAFPYWRGNGNSKVKIKGKKLYQEKKSILQVGEAKENASPEFLGYTLDTAGIPTFKYRRGAVTFTETITANSNGDGLLRHITTSPPTALILLPSKGIEIISDADSLQLTAEQAKDFTFELKW